MLWGAALAVTGALVYVRLDSALAAPLGTDFSYSLEAARNVAAGHSPYAGVKQYVYPPPIALLLAPFAHVDVGALWQGWTTLVVVAPIVGAAAFVFSRAGRMAWWLRPVGFALCSFTLLYAHYWPLSKDLALGQADTIGFPLLTLSALAVGRSKLEAAGALIGVAGLVKVWPAVAAVALGQRGLQRGRRALVALVGTALLAPLLALVFGWSGLVGLLENVFDARQQHLVSDSVWGVPALLFTHSDLARPVFVSSASQVLLSAALAIWVLGLLVTALRHPGDRALCTWNVVFCVLLILPVSHRQYAIYVLPLLWWWVARSLREGPIDRRELAIVAVLVLWWIDQTITWPYNGSPATIPAFHYCVPFVADMIACTMSVLGARAMDAGKRDAGPGCAGSEATGERAPRRSLGYVRHVPRWTAPRKTGAVPN